MPSVQGVGAATLVLEWHIVRPVAHTRRSQRSFPVWASRQSRCNRSWEVPALAVTKTLPSTTTAPDRPRPGRETDHFLVAADSSTGKTPAGTRLLPLGPRKAGHPSAPLATTSDVHTRPVSRLHRREKEFTEYSPLLAAAVRPAACLPEVPCRYYRRPATETATRSSKACAGRPDRA